MCQTMSLHGVTSYFILPFQFVRLFWSRSVVQLMPGMMAESYFMDKCSVFIRALLCCVCGPAQMAEVRLTLQ